MNSAKQTKSQTRGNMSAWIEWMESKYQNSKEALEIVSYLKEGDNLINSEISPRAWSHYIEMMVEQTKS